MRFRTMMVGFPLLVLMATPMAGGCGDEEVDNSAEVKALAEDAGEATGAQDISSALAAIPALNLKLAADIKDESAAAMAASTNMGAWFKPAGCIQAVQSGAKVSYAFTNCTGPLGLVGVNGKLDATFTLSSGDMRISVTSTGLKIGNTAVTHSGGATVSFSGSTRTLKWTGAFKGKTARGGLPLSHNSDYTIAYDAATTCVKVDGSGASTIDTRKVATTTTGYERCGDVLKCPKAGTITATAEATKLSITVKYLGAGNATLTGPEGKTYSYKMLFCTA